MWACLGLKSGAIHIKIKPWAWFDNGAVYDSIQSPEMAANGWQEAANELEVAGDGDTWKGDGDNSGWKQGLSLLAENE